MSPPAQNDTYEILQNLASFFGGQGFSVTTVPGPRADPDLHKTTQENPERSEGTDMMGVASLAAMFADHSTIATVGTEWLIESACEHIRMSCETCTRLDHLDIVLRVTRKIAGMKGVRCDDLQSVQEGSGEDMKVLLSNVGAVIDKVCPQDSEKAPTASRGDDTKTKDNTLLGDSGDKTQSPASCDVRGLPKTNSETPIDAHPLLATHSSKTKDAKQILTQEEQDLHMTYRYAVQGIERHIDHLAFPTNTNSNSKEFTDRAFRIITKALEVYEPSRDWQTRKIISDVLHKLKIKSGKDVPRDEIEFIEGKFREQGL